VLPNEPAGCFFAFVNLNSVGFEEVFTEVWHTRLRCGTVVFVLVVARYLFLYCLPPQVLSGSVVYYSVK
jgi:hypothetical protein